MRKYFKHTILLIALILCAQSQPVQAADTWGSLAPNTLFGDFIKAADDKIISSEYSYSTVVAFYKKLTDSSPTQIEGVFNEGVSRKTGSTASSSEEHKSLVSYEFGTGKKTTTYQMNVAVKKDQIYIGFPDVRAKALKNKWIPIPNDKFSEVGEKMGLDALFAAALGEDNESNEAVFKQSVALAKQYNLYTHLGVGSINDDFIVDTATRYDLALNRDSIAPYYKALAKVLTKEQSEKTLLGVPGFTNSLNQIDFVQYIADHSYVSLWVDTKSNLPARFIQVSYLPPFGQNKLVTVLITDLSWKNPNVPVQITIPKENIVSFEEGMKILKVKLDERDDNARAEIQDLLKKLNKARSKDDKAYLNYKLGQAYDALSESATAATYYQKSASFYPKNSPDYYDALATAEWSLGNGAKVKEYYELALKSNPKDELLLNNYGWFLLGTGNKSFKFQDLQRALVLNQMLVKLHSDDNSLISLYINYLLLGQQQNADALVSRFDNFKSADNYNLIARAYHRMNNKKKEDEYVKLAKEAGYERNSFDDEFFRMKF